MGQQREAKVMMRRFTQSIETSTNSLQKGDLLGEIYLPKRDGKYEFTVSKNEGATWFETASEESPLEFSEETIMGLLVRLESAIDRNFEGCYDPWILDLRKAIKERTDKVVSYFL